MVKIELFLRGMGSFGPQILKGGCQMLPTMALEQSQGPAQTHYEV